MSKSYGNIINMYVPEKELKKQVMSIVTDSTPLEESKNPDNNITKLYSLFATEKELNIMKEKFVAGNYGYGHAKKELLERILDYFKENMDFSKEQTVLFSPATSSFCQFKNFEHRGEVFKNLTVNILG